jgi:repressor LexA|nr:MAG TPA: Repressor protein CI [Caudoviricetes sp.]
MNGQVDTFANRLNIAMKKNNINQIELAEKTKTYPKPISQSLINKYLKGKAFARQNNIYILCKILNVDEAWIMGFDVPMERTPDVLRGATPLQILQQFKIPVLGKVKAGYDYLANENIIGHVFLDFKPSDPENYYALQISGDSMEPLFSDGDIAIVHKQDDFESGNTCIILINGDEATVKKVVRMDDGIDLIAMNPYYPIRHFTKNEMNEIPVKIIGKVVEARKRKIFE